MSGSAQPQVDVLIVGGGAAGLWLLNSLSRSGYECRLLEADALGNGQTLASQGIIHSGLKYGAGSSRQALRDRLRNMPARWRASLAADPQRPPQDPDLAPLKPASDAFYLFSSDRKLDRLRSFVASRLLAADSAALAPAVWPEGLRELGYEGQVIALDEFTVDVSALLERLAAPVRERILQHRFDPDRARLAATGVRVDLPDGPLHGRHLLLCAGAANGPLAAALGISGIRQVERPLHQVVVRDPGLPKLDAHCLTGVTGGEPRLTITSHPGAEGCWEWYLGGQIATTGCDRSAALQIAFARQELAACVPQRSWADAEISTLRINRAEPDAATEARHASRGRACAARQGPVTVCWPIKLTLLPDLADQVLAQLPPPTGQADEVSGSNAGSADGAPVAIGKIPWSHP